MKFGTSLRRLALAALALPLLAAASGDTARHPLTIDDVLSLSFVDRGTLSPDGQWAAIVALRPAIPGEAYGRTWYEVDPSRADVWLVSATGERRNLTNGAATAAGYWCATWSPDGSKLAMLSTQPQGAEPRGGDNVRLYVWDRATGAVTRLSDAAMLTQSRATLGRIDIRGGADRGSTASSCGEYDNAPFVWLDDDRLLAVMLPEGETSVLIDDFDRPMRHTAETRRRIREGTRPTVTAVGSGAERIPRGETGNHAILRTIDVRTRTAVTIAEVPSYPFRGELSLGVAPDRQSIAILATTGAIPPAAGQRIPHPDDSWSVEKRLGFVPLAPGASVRWADLPAEARYPLELFNWSPDGHAVAFRARATAAAAETPIFTANADTLSVTRAGGPSVGSAEAGQYPGRADPVFWIDATRLLVHATGNDTRADWYLLTTGADPINLSAAWPDVPGEFRRTADGRFVALAGGKLTALDVATRTLRPIAATLPAEPSIAWPLDSDRPTADLIVTGKDSYLRIPLSTPATARSVTLPHGAHLLDASRDTLLWSDPSLTGRFVRRTAFADARTRDLLALDTHLAQVEWGRTMLIEYPGKDGATLKGAVILPPGYQSGRRYPVITWVYAGYTVRSLETYFLDPYMGGIYNLQLYAARGYVVLIPSIPTTRDRAKIDLMAEITPPTLAAVDRLVALGIADPDRIGVFGQSFGGYTVYALLTQTNRFKAAVAMAGITDLATYYGQFDTAARGYPGIEQERSYNWSITQQFGLNDPPYAERELYARNSPLTYVDRVETPLLLIHGEYDLRAPMSQAELFFYALYARGKTARLLRYWGENHGLSQSPANVRDIFEETVGWFDRYMPAR